MSFDGTFGNIEIASDLRVVASLEQQIDDLPLPSSHFVEFLFHNWHLAECAPADVAFSRPCTSGNWIWVFSCIVLHSQDQSGRQVLSRCEKS